MYVVSPGSKFLSVYGSRTTLDRHSHSKREKLEGIKGFPVLSKSETQPGSSIWFEGLRTIIVSQMFCPLDLLGQ